MSTLMESIKTDVIPKLREETGRSNVMSLPKLDKVVLSMGLGKAVQESTNKALENKRFTEALDALERIAGQKPVATRARMSVSNFKLRQGYAVGAMVTLRGQRMYEFFERLIHFAIPRVRDFRGLNPNSFDGRGNYNMGLTEYGVFPEIDPDKVSFQQGLNITICTTARNDAEARSLLTHLGMPFRK